MELAHASIAIVGLGGLGCPAALALAKAGVGRLLLVDDDRVDETNLHRQILYHDSDVGCAKAPAAARALQRWGIAAERLQPVERRCLPDTAHDLLAPADLIVEGADNYATKFLVCDAAHLLGKPVVQGSAVAWQGTVLYSAPAGRPCYRCLFEDIPAGPAQSCDTLGVLGALTGFVGALMADLAVRALRAEARGGTLYSYDGKGDRLRQLELQARPGCPLCGDRASILDLAEPRYLSAQCAS
jgi:molybdopterin/thiamine biosynthesis adenylyltransferase